VLGTAKVKVLEKERAMAKVSALRSGRALGKGRAMAKVSELRSGQVSGKVTALGTVKVSVTE
jgi:hypothetical protein